MTPQNATAAIRAALGGVSTGDLVEASTQFLATLGYRSDRRLDGQTGSVGDFIDAFPADNADTRSEQDFRDNAKEVRVLFQFTDTEIAATAQRMLLDAEAFSAGNARSFLFAAVALNGDTYPRGRYVSFTREINKPGSTGCLPLSSSAPPTTASPWPSSTAAPARHGPTVRCWAARRSSARLTLPTRTAPTWTSWLNCLWTHV